MKLKNFKILYFMPLLAGLALTQSQTGQAQQNLEYSGYTPMSYASTAGQYLSSHYAQNAYDWNAASYYLDKVLGQDPENVELIRRSMILAIGTGDIENAARRAKALLSYEDTNDLAAIILAVQSMQNNDYAAAAAALTKMPAGDMAAFIQPLLNVWIAAGQGRLETETLNDTSIHLYHAALAALHLNQPEKAEAFADSILSVGTLSNHDALRVADILALTGRTKDAIVLYEGILVQDTSNTMLQNKIAAVKDGTKNDILALIPEGQIADAAKGAALAMYDMSFILHSERSDSSTKIFANLALALNGDLTNAHLLLADTLTRNDRFNEAIAQLSNIAPEHPSYLPAQRHAAELMAEAGMMDDAKDKLNALFTTYNDVESLIRIGDLYRQEENFKNALMAYDKAANSIGQEPLPAEYWHLLYARGMAHEREGNWQSAEADLKAALVFQPNHPYLLNYLGYGWADQGLHLEKSLELIKRAVALRPHDGYIIDSLGWVQYRMGLYEDALPNLEKAVSLLPYDSTINDHLGDVYWKLGRRTEARFQWERAINYSEDQDDIVQFEQKLKYGLEGVQDSLQAIKQ